MRIIDMLRVLALKVSEAKSIVPIVFLNSNCHSDIFALITTHGGHKIIRDPVEKLYTKVSSHEPQVLDCAKHFCRRLNQARDSSKPLNLSHACLSLAIGMVIHV